MDIDNLEDAKRGLELAIKCDRLAEPEVKNCSLDSLFLWRDSESKETYLDSTELGEERKPRVCVICQKEFEGPCKYITCPNCRNRRRPRNVIEIRRI
jgi:hypothetical protein